MTTPPVDLQGDRGALREVPYMGVIFVVAEASKLGFVNGHPDWSNLGQGQPEVGAMRGAPPRFDAVRITPEDHAYGPLEGIPELREMVAEHYNRLYRRDKASRYTAANVGIAQGGPPSPRARSTAGAASETCPSLSTMGSRSSAAPSITRCSPCRVSSST